MIDLKPGTVEIRSPNTDIKINDDVSLVLPPVLKFEFARHEDGLKLTFHKPLPVGKYKGIGKKIPYITTSTEEVVIGLDWWKDYRIKLNEPGFLSEPSQKAP